MSLQIPKSPGHLPDVYSTNMSTSLSEVSSPLAYEPKSHAFSTGWVEKNSRNLSIIPCVIGCHIEFMQI